MTQQGDGTSYRTQARMPQDVVLLCMAPTGLSLVTRHHEGLTPLCHSPAPPPQYRHSEGSQAYSPEAGLTPDPSLWQAVQRLSAGLMALGRQLEVPPVTRPAAPHCPSCPPRVSPQAPRDTCSKARSASWASCCRFFTADVVLITRTRAGEQSRGSSPSRDFSSLSSSRAWYGLQGRETVSGTSSPRLSGWAPGEKRPREELEDRVVP